MTTEQIKEEEKPKVVDSFWERLNTEATENYKQDFESLIKSDELTFNGDAYKFIPVKSKNYNTIEKLREEAPKIDQDKDWDKYYDNLKKRACILIEGMTEEKFDEGDFTTIENVVTAWSVRAIRGFRRTKSGV